MLSQFARSLTRVPGQFSLVRGLCSEITIKSKEEIDKMVKSDKVVVFMKGNPDEPMCGFSKAMVTILSLHDIKFSSFDVLQDQGVREGVKKYANWPTVPQLYINANFKGGCDIILDLHKSGEILQMFREEGLRSKYDTEK